MRKLIISWENWKIIGAGVFLLVIAQVVVSGLGFAITDTIQGDQVAWEGTPAFVSWKPTSPPTISMMCGTTPCETSNGDVTLGYALSSDKTVPPVQLMKNGTVRLAEHEKK
jgi:hypothetical protein